VKFNYAFVGDSRVAQLGTSVGGGDKSLKYGFIPDDNIFAQWGCKLVQYGTQAFTRTKITIKGKVSHSYFDRESQSYTITLFNDSLLTENAFKIIDAVPSGSLSQSITTETNGEVKSIYEEQDSMAGKSIVCEGIAQRINNSYVMQFLGADASPTGEECNPTLLEIGSQVTTSAKSVNQVITLLNSSSETYGNNAFVLSEKAKELAQNANKTDFIGACFWIGINDIQIYKNAFLGEYRIGQQTAEQSGNLYIKSWINAYKELV
jgi:hypothetical protein